MAVPALISESTFARAQERLAENQRLSVKNTREITLLQGLLVCGQCGYALYRTSTRTTKRQAKYYRCLGSDRWRHMMETPCACRPIRVEDLDEMVWTQVEQLLEDPTLIRAELERRRDEGLRTSPIKQRQQRVRQDLQRLSQQIDKLLDAYQEGLLGLGELRQRMPVLRKKQAAAQKELECAHWQALADEQLRQLDQSLETFLGRLKQSAQTLTVIDKQKIIRLLVKEIIVEKDAITVRHCIPLTGGVTHAEPMCEQLAGQINQPSYQVCLGSHLSDAGEYDLKRTGRTPAQDLSRREGQRAIGKVHLAEGQLRSICG
jgi:site-specific DNA recombinase